MPHYIAQIIHTIARFWDHYAICIKLSDYIHMLNQIRNGTSIYITTQNHGNESHLVMLDGEIYTVIFDPETDHIATVLEFKGKKIEQVYGLA